jgi:phosphoribosylcarboxyaminoimidazole (NCAIR) mutase
MPLLASDDDELLSIAHLFQALAGYPRKRSEWEKRMSLWIASNGRCSECGGFLAANTLVPVKSTPTAEHPFVRVAAACPGCAGKR